VKSIIPNLVQIVLIALFSLPFLALYVLVFFGLGGGWAYAGQKGCHFVIGPIGYAMFSCSNSRIMCFGLGIDSKPTAQYLNRVFDCTPYYFLDLSGGNVFLDLDSSGGVE